MMNHFTTYDALSLTLKLQEKLDDVSVDEIQMFSYLACLLSIYDGKGANDWGYLFIKNELGAPYNNDIVETIKVLADTRMVKMKDREYFLATRLAHDRYALLSKMKMYEDREKYLSASAKCIKFVPYADVRSALYEEPTLLYSKRIDERQILLDGNSATIHLLYRQFDNLRTALRDRYKNLVIPALVWMSHNSNRQFG